MKVFLKFMLKVLTKLGKIGGIASLGKSAYDAANEFFGGNKSEVYKNMTSNGKEKVDGFKKALEAASNAQDPKAAASALRGMAKVYSEEALLIATKNPTLAKEAQQKSIAYSKLADAVGKGKVQVPKASDVSQNNNSPNQNNSLDLAATSNSSEQVNSQSVIAQNNVTDATAQEDLNTHSNEMYKTALESAPKDTSMNNDQKVAKVLLELGFPAELAVQIIATSSPDVKDMSETEKNEYGQKVTQSAQENKSELTVAGNIQGKENRQMEM